MVQTLAAQTKLITLEDKMPYRADIQGLRAIAVLAVIVFHVNPAWLPGGFVGVDIFLVISGYLIGKILLHRKSFLKNNFFSTLKYFYVSRLLRIVPAYFVTLVFVSLLASVLFTPSDFSIFRDGLKQAIVFNSNNYFANFGDYFAPANYEQPLLHTWSLAIEIQFYLIAPFIFLLIERKLLQWLLPIAVIILTAYAEYRLQTGIQQTTYYSLLARLPAFLLGAWVAIWISNENFQFQVDKFSKWLTFFATILITVAFINPVPTGHFPGVAGLIPAIAAALIILTNAKNKFTAIYSSKFMIWIGGISFSLYLWHWPVLAFIRYCTGSERLSFPFIMAFFSITVSLAAISYYCIENSFRFGKGKKQLIGYFCLALVVIATASNMKNVNNYYTPSLLPVDYTRYADHETICQGKIVGDCLKGDLKSNKEILVLGDSHAAMLNYFFDHLGKEIGFKARVITSPSCVTIPGFDYERIPERTRQQCLDQITEVEKYLLASDMIFIGAIWSRHLNYSDFMNALTDFIEWADKNNKMIFLMAQEPLLKNSPQRVVRIEALGIHTGIEVDERYIDANLILSRMEGKYKNTRYLSFEDTGFFSNVPFHNNELIYYDSHHLNKVGAINYAVAVQDRMSEILEVYFDEE